MKHYPRSFEKILEARLRESPRLIQAVLGPRQVGKTSGVLNVLKESWATEDYEYLSCEEEFFETGWLMQKIQKAVRDRKKILVLDEIQKIEGWSEVIKLFWDKLKREGSPLHCVLLGSSSLQLSQGLGESLTGRFEIIPVHHWAFAESQAAFGLDLNEYLLFGGYPGAYPLRADVSRFRKYLSDSIFETVVLRDILRYASVRKPALFRQTFILVSQLPAQEVSYNKLLGQLQEAGNVEQIKHYLDLFNQAFLLRLIFKWTGSMLTRTSSPKLLPAAPVFTSLFLKRDPTQEEKGRIFEAAVGNRLCESFESVHYWREGRDEMDFVVQSGRHFFGIEVKSKYRKAPGATAFRKAFKGSRICVVDMESYPEFERDPLSFLEAYSF
jgi:hypothetical protein